MTEQSHARFYNGLPPVRPERLHWLKVGAFVVLAAAALAVGLALPVFAFYHATHVAPSNWWGGGGRSFGGNVEVFDWHSLMGIGLAFIVGGSLGVLHARSWWSKLALYAVGLPGSSGSSG